MTAAVSVLMPVYDTARYLEAALASVTAQTFADFELLVVDDGSKDGSSEILRAFAAREPRARVFHGPNRGLISARNQLLNEAQAPLIAWMDSDDIALPWRLERQVAVFTARPELLALGGGAVCIDPRGAPLKVERYPLQHADIVERQRVGGAFRFPTVMMRRQAARDVGGFREPFVVGEDFDLLVRLAERGQLANLDEPLLGYRMHLASASLVHWSRWFPYRDLILELAEERQRQGSDRLQRGEALTIPTPPRAPAPVNDVRLGWALDASADGFHAAALHHAWDALREAPSRTRCWKTSLRVAARALTAGREGPASQPEIAAAVEALAAVTTAAAPKAAATTAAAQSRASS
ncbi:MAG TPA: glycosyltransferase [Polyangiaceae bacterium]|nr:glycosyltransferase [Polyangiaceae bacterium]